MPRENSISTRTSLLERIKDAANDASWSEFARTYRDLIRGLALKARLTEDEAEEVVQEVLISVARHIGNFTYDPKVSSFKRWLSNMTRWRIADQQRRRFTRGYYHLQPGEEGRRTDVLERIAAPVEAGFEADWRQEWSRNLVETALARIKNRTNAKDYQIYFLHVLKEKPAAEVCRQLKVNRGQVYLAKLRVGRLVEAELRTLGNSES